MRTWLQTIIVLLILSVFVGGGMMVGQYLFAGAVSVYNAYDHLDQQ